MNLNHARSLHKCSRPALARQLLEQSWHKKTLRHWSHQLKAWGVRTVAALTQGQEPRISQVVTGNGPQWKVYDPVGDRIHWFHQEQEVRAWLEQRYYGS